MLHRQICEYDWPADDDDGHEDVPDAAVVRKVRLSENRFLERCHLPTEPVDLAEGAVQGAVPIDDTTSTDDDDDEDRFENEREVSPQLVAFSALEMQLHRVVHDCRALSDEAKERVVLVIRTLTRLKMTLLLSPSTFHAAHDGGVMTNIVAFDRGRLGVLLFRGLGMLRMQTQQGYAVRHALRSRCALHCMQVAERTAIARLQKQDADGALQVTHDLLEFARAMYAQD